MSGTPASQAQQLDSAQGFTIQTFLASLIVSFVVFGVEVLAFILIKQGLPRIYRPRTFLVPESERINAPPDGFWRWALPVFHTSNSDFIQKCGLDAYFFLRYLRMLLKIFIPMAVIILPILVPLNAVGGRNTDYFQDAPYNAKPGNWNHSSVVGLNQLSWGNVRPSDSNRYWVHLLLALAVIIYCCYIFHDELRGYIRLRQAYLTSPQHRIRASATTVLVSAIPRKWCTVEALEGLYDVFPGGIRNIWINRNFDELSDKVEERNDIALKLEAAQTELIRNAKKNYLKQQKKEAKKAGKRQTKQEVAAEDRRQDEAAATMAEDNPKANQGTLKMKNPLSPVPVLGEGIETVGKIGKSIFAGLRNEVHADLNATQGFVLPSDDEQEPLSATHTDGVGDGLGPGYHIPNAAGRLSAVGGRSSRADQPLTVRRLSQESRTDSQPMVTPMASRPQTPPAVNGQAPEQESPASPNSTYGTQGIDKRINRKSSVSTTPRPAKGKPGPIPVVTDTIHPLALPSPIPKGHRGNGLPGDEKHEAKNLKSTLMFWKKEEAEPVNYPSAANEEFDSVNDDEPLWKKYLEPKDRDTMRLPIFGIKALGWLPFVGKKVDTIDYCRKELARLNLEIEIDQGEPEKFPLMNSAFIQFNHQVAAHMACQSLSHHVPSRMAPRIIEISPGDVVWDNLSVQWWERYVRTGAVLAVVVGLVLAWTFPVAFTGLLANIKYLSATYPWLAWLGKIPYQIISPIQGVLPQALLALLLALLPVVLRLLARLQGLATGMTVELRMADFYFFFLFVQVFLVVTIASGATNVFSVTGQLGTNPAAIPNMLASSIPRASNYYFSYMILQALSTSGGTLLQIGSLVGWFILAPLLDSTARAKWKRQITLPDMQWGSFFPVYSNMACIGLIYSVISPLILIFNCITFSLFWFVFRYNTLYVTKFEFDTGGLLFPKAINHTFVGLYVMEICLIGLFFLETGVNADGTPNYGVCVPQGIIMVIALVATIIFHYLLSTTFGPLVRYLPITLEDDAVERDEEFARAQGKRFNIADEEHEGDDINDVLEAREEKEDAEDDAAEAYEMQDIADRRAHRRLDPRALAQSASNRLSAVAPHWTQRRRSSAWLYNPQAAKDGNARVDDLIRAHRMRRTGVLENGGGGDGSKAPAAAGDKVSTAIGDALFAGISDEIEDLSPEDREFLVQRAFQHAALRARRPVVWIPRDDLGVSDDEIARTNKLSEHIWISNQHTGLDSKVRVIFRKSPPDFSEIDLIYL